MEEQTYIIIGAAGLAAFLAWKYFDTSDVVAPILPQIVATGGTSNAVITPSTTTTTPSSASQASVVGGSGTGTGINTVPQGTVSLGVTQAELTAIINSTVLTSLTLAQQNAMTSAQINQFMNNQQVLLTRDQASKSSGLPSVINPANAGLVLQIPQSVIDSMKMGSSVGTNFGTFSLQASGFVTIDKVDYNAERQLVSKYGNLTWNQFKSQSVLSGLAGFVLGL